MAKISKLLLLVIITALGFAGIFTLGQENARAQLDNNCIISINKSATPANDKVFSFSLTGDQVVTYFLSDPSHPLQVIGINVGQTVTVTEDSLPGWTLDGIECTEGITTCGSTSCLTATVDGSSVTFQCFDNDTASCTFTNSFTGSAIPTLSEWGLIAMAALIGAAGIFMAVRRRRAAA